MVAPERGDIAAHQKNTDYTTKEIEERLQNYFGSKAPELKHRHFQAIKSVKNTQAEALIWPS